MSERTSNRPTFDHVQIGSMAVPVARPLPHRLLGVWAHPDDECYLSAGLMARVIAAGGHVRVVCATRGELGTSDPELIGSGRFARLRDAELRASLAELGVDDVHFLDLPDGACADADPSTMADVIADHVRAIDADTVVTFGPDGITAHADHVAVSHWATAAAPDGVELLYATMTHDFARRHRELHERIGLFADLPGGRPRSVHRGEVALQASLDRRELRLKRRALHAHGSQTAALAELVGEAAYRSWWRDECFRRPTPAERRAAAPPAARIPVGAGS